MTLFILNYKQYGHLEKIFNKNINNKFLTNSPEIQNKKDLC